MLQISSTVDDTMSNLTSATSNEASISSNIQTPQQQQPPNSKKRRNLPGNPDPEAEVVALSPKSLMATNRFVCEICSKGFQRDQNLQLHRRGHNLPWKLKQRTNKELVIRKKVYVCPEQGCVHHDPSRALGDLTGIKKHFSRKHGEKKWKCGKCSKRYAVQSDWKAHSKICGTREYRCDCGTLFSRRDSFVTHRAFCDALAEESSRSMTHMQQQQNPIFLSNSQNTPKQAQIHGGFHHPFVPLLKQENQTFNQLPQWLSADEQHHPFLFTTSSQSIIQENPNPNTTATVSSSSSPPFPSIMSATALLQKASQMGVTMSSRMPPHHHVGAPGVCSTSSTNTATNNTTYGTAGSLLPSREEMGTGLFVHGLASFGEKLVNVTPGCMQLQDNVNSFLPSSSSATSCGGGHGGFDGPSSLAFEDSFEGMLNTHRKTSNNYSFQENAHLIISAVLRKEGGIGGDGAGGDGMTRDFLGLRAFPDRDFLNMDGFGQMGYDDHHQI